MKFFKKNYIGFIKKCINKKEKLFEEIESDNDIITVKKSKKYNLKKRNYYCKCGEKKEKRSKCCKKCVDIKLRKVERPSYDKLIKEIEESNYSALGRKYGVSDNAIRKWKQQYEIKMAL